MSSLFICLFYSRCSLQSQCCFYNDKDKLNTIFWLLVRKHKKPLKTRKKLKNSSKKYFNQLSGACCTQKIVEIHKNLCFCITTAQRKVSHIFVAHFWIVWQIAKKIVVHVLSFQVCVTCWNWTQSSSPSWLGSPGPQLEYPITSLLLAKRKVPSLALSVIPAQ